MSTPVEAVPGAPRLAKSKKRLIDGSIKTYQRKNPYRKLVDLFFATEAEKVAFEKNIQDIKSLFGMTTTEIVNESVKLLLVVRSGKDMTSQSTYPQQPTIATCNAETSYAQTVKKEHDNERPEGSQKDRCSETLELPKLFIFDLPGLKGLIETVENHRGMCKQKIELKSSNPCGFVSKFAFQCKSKHIHKVCSSSTMGKDFTVNCSIFTAFICSGMLEIQFKKFTNLANIGTVHGKTFNNILHSIALTVDLLRIESIAQARSEEAEMEDGTRKGIHIETDVLNACRKNSLYTDVVAIGAKSHKVVAIMHLKKDCEKPAQKHELDAISKIYKELDEAGYDVLEHVHGRNMSVKKCATNQNGTENADDCLHEMEIAKEKLSEIGAETKCTDVMQLHSEPCDKTKGIHFIESFNNVCLIYLDKRIRYSDHIFNLRESLAVIDWNEHVCRKYTSIWDDHRFGSNIRQKGKKNYTAKSFKFVRRIWALLVSTPPGISTDNEIAMNDCDSEEILGLPFPYDTE